MLTRRKLLQVGLMSGVTVLGTSCHVPTTAPAKTIPGIRCLIVHPYQDHLRELQFEAIDQIWTGWIRTTLGILDDAAGQYVEAAGGNVLGVLTDFGLGTIPKTDWPDMVVTALRRYPTLQYVQILNEPKVFNDIGNAEYVEDYLRPAHDLIRREFPHMKIVAAAPIGQPRGIQDFKAMSDAGADQYCDFRAVHIYFEESVLNRWSTFRYATDKPIMVTETGIRDPKKHFSWWRNALPKMQQLFETPYVFYYVLMEYPTTDGFGLITGERDTNGKIIPTPGSDLFAYLSQP
jgi:hypothetical protein